MLQDLHSFGSQDALGRAMVYVNDQLEKQDGVEHVLKELASIEAECKAWNMAKLEEMIPLLERYGLVPMGAVNVLP